MDGLLLFAELVFLSIKPSSSSIIFNSFAAIASNDSCVNVVVVRLVQVA